MSKMRIPVIPFLALAVFLLAMAGNASTHNEAVRMSRIDHLVYATPDLAAGVERVEKLLGVHAIPGGQHPGAGTRNALIGLGNQVYLEIIGPDPDQPKPPRARRFGIDELKSPRLVTWAAKGADLDRLVADSRRQGIDLGQVQAGSRQRPDGVMLAWKLTVSPTLTEGGVVPFLIDWGATTHPASALPKGCTLVDLRAEHPNPEHVQAMITGLGLDLPVKRGPAPALIATIATPRGVLELR
ncbi:MAG TPA: VOC family protein [Blastocatellia bacterium]|nr:VOC family protein [Blastocatellia bacterium]